MELINWAEIAGGVLLLASILFGFKLRQAKKLLKELAEAITALSDAVADNKITNDERNNMLKQFGDVIKAAQKLFRRG